MLKRTTAYIFIIIANITLLAHAVIPHHHHHHQICVEAKHCHGAEDAQLPNTNHHEHDGDKNSAGCILKQAIVLPNNQSKHQTDFINCFDNHATHFLFTLFVTGCESSHPNFTTVTYNFEISESYTNYLSASSSLRAPPTV